MSTRAGALGAALMALFALVGCRPALPSSWVSDEVVTMAPAERFADAPAEVLHLGHTLVMSAEDDWYIQQQHHEVRRINDASGLDYANIFFTYDTEYDELVDFRARSIAPDGTRREVGVEALFVDQHGETTVASFRFPQVEVGSVLEYVYTLETPDRYYNWHADMASGPLPVRRYRLDIRGTDNIEHSVDVFNVPDDAVQRARYGNWWRVAVAVDDLPAFDAEPLGPRARRGGVWYLYKTRSIGRLKARRTWASETMALTGRLYEEHPWLDGFDDVFDAAACRALGGQGCVAGVMESVHEATRLEARTIWRDVRALGDVLASGTATSLEKAALAWARLEAAGIEARYALIASDARDFFEVDSPYLRALDHVLLYVPAQDGLDEALWIDPACESCAPGELPHGSDVRHAIILRQDGSRYYAGTKRPEGRIQAAESTTRRTRIEVDAAGNALVHETVVTERAAAERRIAETARRTAREHVEALDRELSRRVVGQRNLQVEIDCDRRAGRCIEVRSYELAGYAIIDGGVMHVPLTVLETPLESSFAAVERSFPVFLDARHDEHQVELVVPEAFVLSAHPRNRTASAARGAVTTRLDFMPSAQAPLHIRWQLQTSASEHEVAAYPEIRRVVRQLVGLRGSAVTYSLRQVPGAQAQPQPPAGP